METGLGVLWILAGIVGTIIMWRKGYFAEYIGCVILAGGLPILFPVVLGGIILAVALILPDKHKPKEREES